VVHELPYAVSKSAFILKVAELVQTSKLAGVAEVRDESDRDGMRIVLELKRDANPALVTNHILKATPLQASFAGNLLALTEGGRQPTRVTLRQCLLAFIAFRKQTTRKRAQAQADKAQARLHIAHGLALALAHVDAVVAALRGADSVEQAKAALCAGGAGVGAGGGGGGGGGGAAAASDGGQSGGQQQQQQQQLTPIVPGGFSAAQADAILAMPLRRLTSLETGKLAAEVAELGAELAALRTLLTDDGVLVGTLVAEQRAMRDKFGRERQTRISDEARELSDSGAGRQHATCALPPPSRPPPLPSPPPRVCTCAGAECPGANARAVHACIAS
jgi:DNA gyrase subunit A